MELSARPLLDIANYSRQDRLLYLSICSTHKRGQIKAFRSFPAGEILNNNSYIIGGSYCYYEYVRRVYAGLQLLQVLKEGLNPQQCKKNPQIFLGKKTQDRQN